MKARLWRNIAVGAVVTMGMVLAAWAIWTTPKDDPTHREWAFVAVRDALKKCFRDHHGEMFRHSLDYPSISSARVGDSQCRRRGNTYLFSGKLGVYADTTLQEHVYDLEYEVKVQQVGAEKWAPVFVRTKTPDKDFQLDFDHVAP